MAINQKYPYTDIHELNLDWLLRKMKELEIDFDEFKVINQITFGGAWDITHQYPRWCIVSDNNIGYISILPVPAGVVLTNTDYWREVIDYSAQIAGLQTRVVALENTVGDASSGLVHDVDELQTDVSQLQTDIADLTIDKTELILFGDSWSDYDHDTANVRIPQTLAQGLELTVHNYSYGGTGFDVPNGYDEQIDWYVADTSFDHKKVKYVVLVAGLNEYNGGTSAVDFATKLDDWLTKIYAVIPENTPVYWFHNYSLENDGTRPIPTYYYNQRNYYRDIPTYTTKKCIFCNTFAWADVDNFNTNNYYHLNAVGSVEFAENMIKAINGIAPTLHKYDYHIGVANTTAVSDALKKVPTYFYVDGSELVAEVDPTMALLGNAASGTPVEYTTRNLPAKISTGGYMSQGMSLETSQYDSWQLFVQNTSSRYWGATQGGRFKSGRLITTP